MRAMMGKKNISVFLLEYFFTFHLLHVSYSDEKHGTFDH